MPRMPGGDTRSRTRGGAALLRILGLVLALFLAYVVGRAIGILTGIGPYPTEALAITAVLAWVAFRSRRR